MAVKASSQWKYESIFASSEARSDSKLDPAHAAKLKMMNEAVNAEQRKRHVWLFGIGAILLFGVLVYAVGLVDWLVHRS
jgi:hypothetical protein